MNINTAPITINVKPTTGHSSSKERLLSGEV
jgi:hypothetical protein